jgi:DNA-binding LacI/PurR family transcriptional regulator
MNKLGVQVLTHLTSSNSETSAIVADHVRRHDVDAVVFVGSQSELPDVSLPSVYIGEVPYGARVWQVRSDNLAIGRYIGEYLWSAGHRSIAMINADESSLPGLRRLEGLRSTWEERGGTLPSDHVVRTKATVSLDTQLRAALPQLFRKETAVGNPVTAVVCFNDWVAGHVLKTLSALGLSVPGDVSVVGVDDSIYASLLNPALTTVHVPFDELGTYAAQLVLEQAEHPSADPRVIIAGGELVVRESSAPLSSGQ